MNTSSIAFNYIVDAFAILEGAATIGESFGWRPWPLQAAVTLTAIGSISHLRDALKGLQARSGEKFPLARAIDRLAMVAAPLGLVNIAGSGILSISSALPQLKTVQFAAGLVVEITNHASWGSRLRGLLQFNAAMEHAERRNRAVARRPRCLGSAVNIHDLRLLQQGMKLTATVVAVAAMLSGGTAIGGAFWIANTLLDLTAGQLQSTADISRFVKLNDRRALPVAWAVVTIALVVFQSVAVITVVQAFSPKPWNYAAALAVAGAALVPVDLAVAATARRLL